MGDMQSVATRFAVIVVSLFGFASTTVQGASCDRPAESTTQVGLVASPGIDITPGGWPTRYRAVPEITPRYYMLHLVPSPSMSGEWSLTLRDKNFRVLAVLGPADFSGANAVGRWTGRLPAEEVWFDFYAADATSNAKITLDEAIIMPKSAINPRYSWQGQTARYQSLYQFSGSDDEQNRVRRLGDRVGFLIGSGPAPGGPASWCCSGIMVTRDLYLTNWHCGAPTGVTSGVWHSERCLTTLVDLSWDEDAISSELNCTKVIASSERLDYALLRIAPVTGNAPTTTDSRPLFVTNERVSAQTEIRIVHHAECKRKLLSQGCRVLNANYENWRTESTDSQATDFSHDCDTEGGSSGGPVFDARGALVGLHHLGFAINADNQCDKENKAVHILDILDNIKSLNHEIYQEIQGHIVDSID